KTHVDLFAHFRRTCRLADEGAVIGVSGGEPTLYKDALFELIATTLTERPDLSFHVLTNAQHFDEGDLPTLRKLGAGVCWGVPLYSVDPLVHDEVVVKDGAYERLHHSFSLLAQ